MCVSSTQAQPDRLALSNLMTQASFLALKPFVLLDPRRKS